MHNKNFWIVLVAVLWSSVGCSGDETTHYVACVEEKCGLIDGEGRFVVTPQFEALGQVKQGLAAAKLGNSWGFIDTKGSYVVNPQYEEVRAFEDGLAAVKQQRKWGYIDREGTLVIPPQFDAAGDFHEGLAAMRQGARSDTSIGAGATSSRRSSSKRESSARDGRG